MIILFTAAEFPQQSAISASFGHFLVMPGNWEPDLMIPAESGVMAWLSLSASYRKLCAPQMPKSLRGRN